MSSLPVAFLKYIAQLLLCVYFVYCGVVAAEKEPSELEPDMIMEESKNIVCKIFPMLKVSRFLFAIFKILSLCLSGSH